MLADEQDAHAGPPPKKKQGLSRLSVAALAGAHAADGLSTIYALTKDHVREANPLFGEQPSAAKVLAIKGAGTAAQWWMLKQMAKSKPKLANAMAKGIAAGLGVVALSNVRQANK